MTASPPGCMAANWNGKGEWARQSVCPHDLFASQPELLTLVTSYTILWVRRRCQQGAKGEKSEGAYESITIIKLSMVVFLDTSSRVIALSGVVAATMVCVCACDRRLWLCEAKFRGDPPNLAIHRLTGTIFFRAFKAGEYMTALTVFTRTHVVSRLQGDTCVTQ